MIVGSVLVIVQPWGRRTLLYVVGFAGLVMFGIVAALLIAELARSRRAS